MPVTIGEVTTFANPKADKAQVLKIGEECMEVFSAWEDWVDCAGAEGDMCDGCAYKQHGSCSFEEHMMDECADLITATANLLAALGVDDMREAMAACEARNRERGRL